MTTPPPAVRAAEAIEGMIRPQCPPIYQDEIKHIITSEYAPMVEAAKELLSLCDLEDKHGRLVIKDEAKETLRQLLKETK